MQNISPKRPVILGSKRVTAQPGLHPLLCPLQQPNHHLASSPKKVGTKKNNCIGAGFELGLHLLILSHAHITRHQHQPAPHFLTFRHYGPYWYGTILRHEVPKKMRCFWQTSEGLPMQVLLLSSITPNRPSTTLDSRPTAGPLRKHRPIFGTSLKRSSVSSGCLPRRGMQGRLPG